MLVRLAVIATLMAAAPASAAPAVEITAERVIVDRHPTISTDLLFEVGSASLTPAGKAILDAVAKPLAKDPTTQLSINCFTDTTAPDNDRTGVYLGRLSRERAEAVAAYLAKHGVAPKRMTAQGFGAADPVGDNATDDGKAENRRIEILIASEVRGPSAGDLAGYLRTIPGKGLLIATIATNQGTFHCELFEDQTPLAVANFVGLATGQKAWLDPRSGKIMRGKPLYDGLTFHRVIPGFMIQGGDPRGNGTGGPGYAFRDELLPDLSHQPGTLAMANAGPGTNGSQFFIDEIAAHWLDGHHTIFGRCKETDLVTKIANVPRDSNDRPNQPVVIDKVTITRGAF